MRVLVQWTRANPRGWEEIDSTEWRSLPKRPDPTGRPASADDADGWVFGLCVQGVHITADHYAIEPLAGRACRTYQWNDDPLYYPPGWRNGQVRTFRPLRRDTRRGGVWNTEQTVQVYGESDFVEAAVRCGRRRDEVLPFSAFPLPDDAIVRHGKLVSAELNAEHDRLRDVRGWREWTEGVPASDLVRGSHGRPQVMKGAPRSG